ncbi:septin domain-containing protein [Sarocladium implicatum]|nr:septin domain-containing protein [Sarocladium implicatum]
MRPLPDADALAGRSSHRDIISPPSPQMSCFITTEAALDSTDSQDLRSPHRLGRWPRPKRSQDLSSHASRTADSSPNPAPHSPASLSSSVLDDDMLHDNIAPMTPVLTGLSGPGSVISSSSSRRNSLTASSRAERDSSVPSPRSSPRRSPNRPGPSPHQGAHESPESQLIMPSLTVPPRRSFSEAGRTIGKLKILVTGPPGTGKTSLIHSITRCSPHIVHVDPARSSSSPASETFASTKPQPRWKTELELSASTRRRRSSVTASDEVLDRNICFVDTTSASPAIQPTHAALQYVENQVTPILYKSLDDSDLWSLLISGSQPAVDVVLYMVPSKGLSNGDFDAMKRLQGFTNVVPVFARADELSDIELSSARAATRARLEASEIKCFSFDGPNAPIELFSVSNVTQPDLDEMDASTLMRSEYEQPLTHSDLDRLVDVMISAEGSAWLRHTSALKTLKWCRENRQASTLQAMVHQPSTIPHLRFNGFHGMDAYTAAQWWQRVKVTDWAQSLRRSLDAQSSGFTHPSNALEVRGSDPAKSVVKHDRKGRKHRSRQSPSPTHQDPLGLLDWVANMRQGGKLTAELLSGLGVAAAFTAWLHMSDSACHREMASVPRGLVGWWWDFV